MRIYLIRHGMSQSNADWDINRRVADHAIELTSEGSMQAEAAGNALAEHFARRFSSGIELGSAVPLIRLWTSPYKRTRQTTNRILEACRPPQAKRFWIKDHREHLLLAEQQFGIFDGLSDEERAGRYPDFQAYYEKCKRFEGKMWPKMPLGESRFEVCQRVHQAFGTFKRDAERHKIEDIVVVAHGTTIRAFVMMWLHLPYEWMHNEPNPKNCSIRLIKNGTDMGYIFEGFENPAGYRHKANQETEE